MFFCIGYKEVEDWTPIERHERSIYTRTVYHLFCEELYKAGNYTIKHHLNDSQFVLIHAMFDEGPTATQFKVTLHDAESIHCSCGLYKHKGHALKVS